MNHAVRHHAGYSSAALSFRRTMAAMPAMRYFQHQMQHEFEAIYGPDVTVPPMDVLAKLMAADFARDIPAREPTQEERDLVRGLVYHRGKDVTERMDDYANWSRVAWRVFDTAYAKEFTQTAAEYDRDDHLRILRQVKYLGDAERVEHTFEDIKRAAQGTVGRTRIRVTQTKASKNATHEARHHMPNGLLQDGDTELSLRLKRRLVEHEDTLCERWYSGLWELMFSQESKEYDKVFPNDALAFMNTALTTHSPEVGQFFPSPEEGINPDYEHLESQLMALPDDIKDMAAGVVILRQAQASIDLIAQRVNREVGGMRRGSFGAKERQEIYKKFNHIFYDETLYHREPYRAGELTPESPMLHPTRGSESVSLSEWLGHLTHEHVHGHAQRKEIMEEVSRMREEATDVLLAHCEQRVNGAKAKREVG